MTVTRRKALSISNRVLCEQKNEINALKRECNELREEISTLFQSKKGGMDHDTLKEYNDCKDKLCSLEKSYEELDDVRYTNQIAIIEILTNIDEEELKADFPELYEYVITQDEYEATIANKDLEEKKATVKAFFAK